MIEVTVLFDFVSLVTEMTKFLLDNVIGSPVNLSLSSILNLNQSV